jgi:hypothetical protein
VADNSRYGLGAGRPIAAQRWLLVRGFAVLVLSAATSASSLMLLGLGLGLLFFTLLALVAGITASAVRSPSKWVFFGFLLSVGLYIGGLRVPFFTGAKPSMVESAIWFSAGILGFGMVLVGYYKLLLGRED